MSTSSTNAFDAQTWTTDPVFGQVYKVLLSDKLGSWAVADELYTNIRTEAIWSELNTMTAKKPTKASTERAAELIDELGRLSVSAKTFADATNVVKLWTPPRSLVVKKPAAVNVFSALHEGDSDDDE